MFSQIFVFLYPGKNRRRLSTSSMSLPHCKHNVSWNLEKDRLENILIYSLKKLINNSGEKHKEKS